MSEKMVLIDGHSILNRAFYGVPELTNSEGLHTNAVYGFLNILFGLFFFFFLKLPDPYQFECRWIIVSSTPTIHFHFHLTNILYHLSC